MGTPHSNFQPTASDALRQDVVVKPVTDRFRMQQTSTIYSPPKTSRIGLQETTVQVKTYHTWTELEILRAEWNDILHSAADSSIFSTPEWLGAWWKSYGESGQLLVAAVYAGSLLVGLAPLYSHSVRPLLGSPLRALCFVGDGSWDSDNLSFIIRPGYEELFVQSFVNWLVRRPGWDLCRLRTMACDSAAIHFFLRTVKQLGWAYATSTQPWSAIVLPQSWEEYLLKLSGKERGKVRYRRRRLEKQYDTRFYRCTKLDELPGRLEQLFSLHQKRWNQRGETGSFASVRRRNFYHQMARSLLTRGCLELWFLELNGKAVAGQCGLRYGDEVCSLQEGFDPDYAADSVGYVLRSYVLQCQIEQGTRRYNFLAGEEKSKERWGTDRGKYLDIEVARPGSRGVRYLKIHQRVRSRKEWLRSHLSPSLMRTLQAARQRIGLLKTDDPTLHDLTR